MARNLLHFLLWACGIVGQSVNAQTNATTASTTDAATTTTMTTAMATTTTIASPSSTTLIAAATTTTRGMATQFTLTKASANFTPRTGPVLEYVSNSILLLFGGKRGGLCLSDAWTSQDGGSVWKVVQDSMPKPSGAFDAPTAVDSSGCLWLLGGECNDKDGQFWKTCDGAPWTEIPRPTVLPTSSRGSALPLFPKQFSNHAIAIVGGWQLVIVDAAIGKGGGIWTFVDRGALFVQKVAETPLPFLRRRDPRLLATSGGLLYLLGGNLCNDESCSNNRVFNDVWQSTDIGSTWTCHAVHYGASLFSTISAGIGRYVAAAIAHDDTIFLVGGRRPTSALGLNAVFSSRDGVADSVFDYGAKRSLWVSASRNVPATATASWNFSLCFLEGVQAGAGTIQLLDYGSDSQPGGVGTGADVSIPINVSITRQIFTVMTSVSLVVANKHAIVLPAGSAKDAAGNPLLSEVQHSFYADSALPVVTFASPAGAGVAPWSTVHLTMNEVVSKGTGALQLVPSVGNKILLNIAAALIVDRNVFFELPKGVRLTEGQEYSIVVPQGLLRDMRQNAVNASTVGTFLVFSGSYTANSYMGDLATVARMAPIHRNVNTSLKPSLLSTYPLSGATDVPVAIGISLVLYFSKPVKFSAVGNISFLDVTGGSTASIDLGASSSKNLLALPLHNAVKIVVPLPKVGGISRLLLRRGYTYNVTVPAGAITDNDDKPSEEITMTFACLAGSSDTAPPEVAMSSPSHQQKGVPSTTSAIDVYFSESIQAASGNIELERPKPSFPLFFSISASSVSIRGAKLSIVLPAAAMNSTGLYTLRIPEGVVKDLSPRKNELSQAATVSFDVVVDLVGPVLQVSESVPAHEPAPQFQRPPSTGFILTFNEVVQAGGGFVVLTPKFTSAPIRIPARSAGLGGLRVFLSPPADLLPGEVYNVSVEPQAFVDLHFNSATNSSPQYTISIAPRIAFQQLGTSQFHERRYGSGIAVDKSNVVYVVAGQNGTMGAGPNASLNDVWRLDTQRPINCASAFEPRTGCSSQVCIAGNPATMGTASVARKVWRPALHGGSNEACLNLTARTEVCPCPLCVTPPNTSGLPAHMDHSSLSSFAFVSAANGTWPLKCKAGYRPTGAFKCVKATDNLGGFQLPYPTCQPLGCAKPPSPVAHYAQFEAANSTGGRHCSTLTAQNPMPHGGNCAIKCNPGYRATTSFVCKFGAFQGAVCSRQLCKHELAPLPNGGLRCGSSSTRQTAWTAHTGENCDVICDAGFFPNVAKVACQASGGLEATPTILPSPSCSRSVCGEFIFLKDTTSKLASESYSKQRKAFGDTVNVTCAPGFHPTAHTGVTSRCAARKASPGQVAVEWQSTLTGKLAGPPCVEDGRLSSPRYAMKGSLQASLDPATNQTLQEMCRSSAFLEGMVKSIVKGMHAIGAVVSASNVTNLTLGHCSNKRLLSIASEGATVAQGTHQRRMAQAAERIDFLVPASDESSAEALRKKLAAPSVSPAFAATFGPELKNLTGVAASGVGLLPPEVHITYHLIVKATTTTTTTAQGVTTVSTSSDAIKILLATLVGLNTTLAFFGLLCCTVRRKFAEELQAERAAAAKIIYEAQEIASAAQALVQ